MKEHKIKELHEFIKECEKARTNNKQYNVKYNKGCYILEVFK